MIVSVFIATLGLCHLTGTMSLSELTMTATETPTLHTKWINSHAITVVKTLQKKGFEAYIVGGCVRDLLIGIIPKDFDLVTNARPRQIKKVIKNAFIIGRRFRLVLVKRGELQMELATFRRNQRSDDIIEHDEEGEPIPVGDNFFGSPVEDAQRRDFTINSLLYDPTSGEVIDHCNGLADLKERTIRMIGDPKTRISEDPIRIFRALRLAYKINFSIEPSLKKAIHENAQLIENSVLPRRREEFIKLLKLKNPAMAFAEANNLNFLKHICPVLSKATENEDFLMRLSEKPTTINHKSPQQLFAFLIWAYYRTFINENPYAPCKAKELLQHPDLLQLMKNELGMFNYEQSSTCKALQMESELPEMASYEEEKLNFLSQKSHFSLAMAFAKLDHSLGPQELFKLQPRVKNEDSHTFPASLEH